MAFPLENLSTVSFFGKDVNTKDFGDLSKENFVGIKRIAISDLQPRQCDVSGEALNRKMKGLNHTTAFVVIAGNDKILIDGHHTVIVKKLKGQKFIYAKCYVIQ